MKPEAAWQAMTTATWHTNADGTKAGWDGIGGAPFYAPNLSTGALRLPDTRGMVGENSGCDSLGVGGVHGDGTRRPQGALYAGQHTGPAYMLAVEGGTGFLKQVNNGIASYATTTTSGLAWGIAIDSARGTPTTAKKTDPRLGRTPHDAVISHVGKVIKSQNPLPVALYFTVNDCSPSFLEL